MLASPARFKVLLCGRRAGKTDLVNRDVAHGLQTDPPGSESLFIAPTNEEARRIFWRPLQLLDRQLGLGLRFDASKFEAHNPRTKSILLMRGSETVRDIERPRGGKYRRVRVDECGAIRPSYLQRLVQEVVEPALMDDPESTLWLSGTPGVVPTGYWHDVSTGVLPGWDVHHWTAADNPHVQYAPFVAELLRRRGWMEDNPTFQREYRGRWVLDGSRTVFRFDPARNIVQELPRLHRRDEWRYVLAVDFGVGHATAYVVLAYAGRWGREVYCVESGQVTGKAPSEVAAWLHSGPMRRYVFDAIVGDVGGLGKAYAQEMLVRYGVEVRAAKKEHRRAAVEVTSDLLHTGKLKSLAVNAELHVQLASIMWDEGREDFAAGQDDDIADALVYGVRETPVFDDHTAPPPEREQNGPDYALDEDEIEEPPQRHYTEIDDV